MSSPQDFVSEAATVAFIDLAGFSAIADVYGDFAAMSVLEGFERMVDEALSGHGPPVKWIGDEAMIAFLDPDTAIRALGALLQACRNEPRLPLTRAAANHGPVIRRAGDLFGSTVNIAARIASLAAPGQLLANSVRRRSGCGPRHPGAQPRKKGFALSRRRGSPVGRGACPLGGSDLG